MGKAEDCVVEVGDVDTSKVEEAFGTCAAFDDPSRACMRHRKRFSGFGGRSEGISTRTR